MFFPFVLCFSCSFSTNTIRITLMIIRIPWTLSENLVHLHKFHLKAMHFFFFFIKKAMHVYSYLMSKYTFTMNFEGCKWHCFFCIVACFCSKIHFKWLSLLFFIQVLPNRNNNVIFMFLAFPLKLSKGFGNNWCVFYNDWQIEISL